MYLFTACLKPLQFNAIEGQTLSSSYIVGPGFEARSFRFPAHNLE